MSNLLRPLCAAAVLCLGMAGASVALAAPAETAAADATVSGVTVMTPKVAHRSLYGLTTTDVGMSVRVPVGDLDVRSPAGKAEFDRRVSEAANLVCGMLNAQYPLGAPDAPGCIRNALRGVDDQVVAALGPG